GRPTPLPLSDLFLRYLRGQTAAQAEGLGYAEPADQVVPHEVVPVQPVDPQLAWGDALAAAAHFAPAAQAWEVPPDWPALGAAQGTAVALAFCLGTCPQLVRTLQPLLSADPAALRVVPGAPAASPALAEWAGQARDYPRALLAAGVLRLARHFDKAEELLK